MISQAATLDAAAEVNTVLSLNNGPIPDNVAFVEVSGTYGTAVIAFQGSVDGANYANLLAIRCDTGAVESAPSMTDDTTRQWKIDVTGMSKFRVYLTSIVSGAVVTQVTTTHVPGGLSVNYQNLAAGNQTISGTVTISSNSATALTVGPNGATNPVLTVVANGASAATGVKVTGAAAASGVAVAAISSGTNENLTLDAKGSGTVTINGTATGNIVLGRAATGVSLGVTGALTALSGTAVPATAGAVAAGAPIVCFSSGWKLWVTSDVPTHTATKGDLCINTGGSSGSTRLYVNNGTTTWIAITTAS